MQEVIAFASRHPFEVVDITGGAPELIPDIAFLISELSLHINKILLRSNLTLLLEHAHKPLLDLCLEKKVALIASFPSVNRNQANAQRGNGVWEKSIEVLQRLNEIGYGMAETDLELHLVANPPGAFMPAGQCQAEKKFKADLARRWGIHFTNLYTFANMPLGRFLTWLKQTGNLEEYIDKLAGSFNPSTIEGLMCRSLINVSWDGFLYDCDFNLAADLPYSGNKVHVTEANELPENCTVMTDNHCYACTAGAGFT